MSEVPDCPYCGAPVHTDRVMDYDNKIKLRCSNCGGFFEFMPGFGAFSLPEQERRGSRRSVRQDGFGSHYEAYEDQASWGTERPPDQQGSCGSCCGVLFCLCCLLPIVIILLSIIFGLGWLWAWF
jgi:hypothetical protein